MKTGDITQRSLGDDHFSSHTHETELFAKRIKAVAEPAAPIIPDRYDEDRCALLMVNPHRLFFYWELSRETRLRYGIGDESAFSLCIMQGDRTVVCEEVHGDLGSYYVAVEEPFARLYATLSWTDENGVVHVLLRSKEFKIGSDTLRYGEGEIWYDKNGSILLHASLSEELPGSATSMSSVSCQPKP